RRLQNEGKPRWNLLGPVLQDRFRGHTIEGVVDLHRLKMLRVVVQHLFIREVFGIEASLPFLVGITAGADEEVHMRAPGNGKTWVLFGPEAILACSWLQVKELN